MHSSVIDIKSFPVTQLRNTSSSPRALLINQGTVWPGSDGDFLGMISKDASRNVKSRAVTAPSNTMRAKQQEFRIKLPQN